MRTFKRWKREKKKTRTRYSIQQSSSMGDVLVIDKVEADRRTRGLSRFVTVVSGGAEGQRRI
jgi:long-subunit acyl-CoA synthetase (AMP-forming)